MIAAAGLLTLAAAPVGAADPTNQTGGPANSFNFTESMQPAWKLQLVALDNKRTAGTMSRADVAAWNKLMDAHSNGQRKLNATTSGGVVPMTSGANSVAGTQQSQHQSYYCGPASVDSTVLSWYFEGRISTTNSHLGGTALSQEALAGPTYTDADAQKQVAWAGTGMTQALNRWLYGYDDAFYYHYTPSSASALTSKVEADINIGAMVEAATYEPAGSSARHYNGHPVSETVRHWPSIYGYFNNGLSLRFEDPAYRGQHMTWSATYAYFNMSNSLAYNYMTQYGATYGIVW